LESLIEQHGVSQLELDPGFTELGDDRIMGVTRWVDADGRPDQRHFVLTVRDGKIADMQACSSLRQAKRFARRRAA
jgi:hypothetical protein